MVSLCSWFSVLQLFLPATLFSVARIASIFSSLMNNFRI